MDGKWNHKIFTLNEASFPSLAIEIFRFQYVNNPVYNAYITALGIDALNVSSLFEIPFLPIRFFKTHVVKTTSFAPQITFESSGTTGFNTSRHFIYDKQVYEDSFTTCFEHFYGAVKDWCVIGLLPSYLERQGSSLVYMVNDMIGKSDYSESGFYLDELETLKNVLIKLEEKQQKTLLIGVTFALLDFAERFAMPLKNTIIMETGGMKGRRKEMTREEVHDKLRKAFNIPFIHSEYGMTELLSQAYSKGNGKFDCPPWMKVLVRDEDDPLTLQVPDIKKGNKEMSGVLNVIDLANIWSCSFIATDDIGKIFENGTFEVQGRIDNSDVRGCNLLIA
jgi:phenylacetate-coenzyme A ligase PaaK-like adenylate-forming protein